MCENLTKKQSEEILPDRKEVRMPHYFGRPSCGAHGSAPQAGDEKWTIGIAVGFAIFLAMIAYIGHR